jgi:hypothetical protein
VSHDPWPFSLAGATASTFLWMNVSLDVGEPGFIRRRRKPDHAGSNPAIQTDRRKGKPTGDGTRPEPGRATSLEGSTPSPSAANEVPVAERPRRRSSKPDRRVRLPPGTLTDGSLTRRRTTGPVGIRQTTQAQNLGCWGFNSPPGHRIYLALADQPGVVATFSPWRAGVQIPSRVLIAVSAGHRRAQVAVTHPHSLCRFNSCPTH